MAQQRVAVRAPVVERRPAVSVAQRAAAPAARSPAQMAQQRLGNQAAGALISGPVQRFAAVSSPRDAAEVEAEVTASRIVRMSAPTAAASVGAASPAVAQRAAAAPAPAAQSVAPTPLPGGGSGAPLPAGVRNFMEPRFGANFSEVRIHTGEAAARQSKALNAHAFTVGQHVFFAQGKYQPDSAAGKELIAHELTHTIQQGAAVQRSATERVTERSAPKAQRLGIGDALDYIADKANYVPGFRILTLVLGTNPINFAPVERSGANVLRALLEMIPITGALLLRALEAHGVIERAGAWIDGKVRGLGLAASGLKRALDAFLDSLGWSDIFDLGGVWERAKRIFTEPIERLIALGKAAVAEILGFVREAVLLPLARLAEGTRGYDLLKAVLGEDPITGQPVARTPDVLIGGFMRLIGREEIWENIKKANAIPRAIAWFEGAMAALRGFVAQIPVLFSNALKSLEAVDFLILPKAFVKIAGVFSGFVVQFVTWAGNAAYTLLELIFDVVAPKVMPYLKRVGGTFRWILDNPIAFVKNLIAAAKLGFQMFADNFGQHLKTALFEWLTGALPGVYIPQSFSLGEIVKFVLSVLGLTWQNIRGKLVKVVGETAVKAMETGFDIVVTLVREGPAAAWDKIKEQLGNLKDMVIEGIISMVTETIVKKAVVKLASMLVPGGAFLSAIISIYDTVVVLIDKLGRMIQVATAFLDSLIDIVEGKLTGAAQKVESVLAGLMSLAISVLAGFLGLGNVADKVMDFINTRIRAPIDKALDAIVDWIVKAGKSLFAKAKEWWKQKKPFKTKGGHGHEISYEGGEKNAVAMVASDKKTPVTQKLGEFSAQAKSSKASPAQKQANALIEATKVMLTKDPNDGSLVANLKVLFETYDEAGAPKKATLSYVTSTLGGDTVGVGMTVDWLGPDHPAGSPPASGAQAKLMSLLVTDPSERSPDKYVRGHLLNENLGGPGEPRNLFPITGKANSQHLKSTEKELKTWVNDSKKYAWYEVKVESVSSKLNSKKTENNFVNCVFVCHYTLKEADGEVKKDVSTSIPSTYGIREEATRTEN